MKVYPVFLRYVHDRQYELQKFLAMKNKQLNIVKFLKVKDQVDFVI